MIYAELEIDLQRVQADAYQVDLRFTDPEPGQGSERDAGEKPRAKGIAALDPGELLALQDDPSAYGKALATQLFADEPVRMLWVRAKTAAESRGLFLRIRLRIDSSAPELHALRWELLRDPESGAVLATSEKTPFSRFMVSSDWRPVRLQPRSDLRALVAVSAPSNLAKYQLADVDLDGEIDRATAAMDGIEVEIAGRDQPLTLELLVERLRAGVDVVYLVCHGALIRRVPRLYLQNDTGEVEVADGAELAQRIAELPQAPRLMVLASCDSALAQTGDQLAAETALAPRLAEAGVPAILAMQGKISMTTVEKAMPAFFAELVKDGQLDRALAVARGAVRDRDDAWMPALYLRLKRGMIWYVPGFGGADEAFLKWKSITSSVHQGTFIPIIGPAVAEHVFGPAGDLAHDLSELHGLPLTSYQSHDLSKVAQFLSVDQSPKYARDQIVKHLRKRLLERLPEAAEAGQLSLPKLLDAVVASQRQDDPVRILSRLPASVFISANLDPLLLKSLKAAGRKPETLLCNWRPTADNHPTEPVYVGEPTAERPILYHVFGVLGRPESLVLTEDDFFDYLLAVAEYKLMPTAVRGQLTRNSLLFLGFRLDLWKFRGLFRQIMALSGKRRLRDFAHVGVQVEPQEDLEVDRLREYLEESYRSGDLPPISIYWGTAADFLRELDANLQRIGQSEALSPIEDPDDWVS
ncbi:MAG: CHAT domain-containing protein [Thermoanaerobaculia bacterium]